MANDCFFIVVITFKILSLSNHEVYNIVWMTNHYAELALPLGLSFTLCLV